MAGSEDSASTAASTHDPKQSKQERIRDNQRRSRAKKQHHIQELEQRLRDSQIKCGESHAQLVIIQDLQHENARLRELLEATGVDQAVVASFLARRKAPDASGTMESGATLRQLKPKISLEHPQRGQWDARLPIMMSAPAAALDLLAPQSHMAMNYADDSFQPRSSLEPASTEDFGSPMLGAHFDVLLPMSMPPRNLTLPSRSSSRQSGFICDSFYVPNSGPLQLPTDATIQCSLARSFISRYGVSGEEMHLVALRLSIGFAAPDASGQGCRVNKGLLMEVLNELGAGAVGGRAAVHWRPDDGSPTSSSLYNGG